MSDIDQEFVEYVVKSLVSNPEAVSIARRIDEKGVLLELTVDPEDLGRVIGKRGATAQSLRTLLRALGTKNDARYNLKIIDNGPPRDYQNSSSDGGYRNDQPQDDNSWSNQPASDNTHVDDVVSDAPVPDSSAADDAASSAADDSGESEEPQTDVAPEAPSEDDEESVVSKTRKELADLDDLDV